MKKNIIWLIGAQRSGKTVFSQALKAAGAMVLNIGEEIRKKIDVEKFTSENTYAPLSMEEFVLEVIQNTIIDFRFGTKETLVIDSAPRSVGQFDVLIKNNDFTHTVIIVNEDFEVRKQRALEKYTNLDYFFKREDDEKVIMYAILTSARSAGINVIYLNNGEMNIWR